MRGSDSFAGRGPERHRLVREPHVRRVPVRVGEDRDRAQAEPAAGPHHAHGDLAPVRHQHLVNALHGSASLQPGDAEGIGRERAARCLLAGGQDEPEHRRVSRGSMTPSSNSRALQWNGIRLALELLDERPRHLVQRLLVDRQPARRAFSVATMDSTFAACSPPITAVRAFGQAKMKRGWNARPHMP